MKTYIPVEGDTLQFVTNSVNSRTAEYRDRAAQLRKIADAETTGKLRDQLLDLAAQYDDLAASTGISERVRSRRPRSEA